MGFGNLALRMVTPKSADALLDMFKLRFPGAKLSTRGNILVVSDSDLYNGIKSTSFYRFDNIGQVSFLKERKISPAWQVSPGYILSRSDRFPSGNCVVVDRMFRGSGYKNLTGIRRQVFRPDASSPIGYKVYSQSHLDLENMTYYSSIQDPTGKLGKAWGLYRLVEKNGNVVPVLSHGSFNNPNIGSFEINRMA